MYDTRTSDWAIDYIKSANTVLGYAYAQLDLMHGAFANLAEYGELMGRPGDANDRIKDALGLLEDACDLLDEFLEDVKEDDGQDPTD